jgi:hypothetical protein
MQPTTAVLRSKTMRNEVDWYKQGNIEKLYENLADREEMRRPNVGLDNNIKIDLNMMDVNWIPLVQNKDQPRRLVNMVMELMEFGNGV